MENSRPSCSPQQVFVSLGVIPEKSFESDGVKFVLIRFILMPDLRGIAMATNSQRTCALAHPCY